MAKAPKCQAQDPSSCADPRCPEKVWRAQQLVSSAGLNDALNSLDKKTIKVVPVYIQDTLDDFYNELTVLSSRSIGITADSLDYLYDQMKHWDEVSDTYYDELMAVENAEEFKYARQRGDVAEYYAEAYVNDGSEKADKWSNQKFPQLFNKIVKDYPDFKTDAVDYYYV